MVIWQPPLKENSIPRLLQSDQPWVRYRVLRELLDKPETDPEVIQAQSEVLHHPQVRSMIAEVSAWPAYPITRHNDASHPIHKLGILADFGLTAQDPGMEAIVEALLSHQSPEGAFSSLVKVPKAFGGTDEEVLSWMLCDAPLVLQALLRFGATDNAVVQKALAHLAGAIRDNGWPCAAAEEFGKFRGPGRKDDPCPYANLIAVRALAFAPAWHNSQELRTGVQMLLDHWQQRAERKMYMFGVGTTYRQLKYPLIWYDILHILDTLSRLPFIHQDPRFLEMMQVLRDHQDDQGMFKAGSVWTAYKGWEYAQKKTPSQWITFLALRILRRVSFTVEMN